MDLVTRTQRRIRAAGLLAQGDALVVAVSGGADSVALLHVLFSLSQKQQWNWRLIVAHVNHGFRRDESAAEAAYVERLAAELGLPCEVARLDLPAQLAAEGGNLQAVARERRYDFLYETAARYGAGKIILAHHADDQAETVLMRVLRGTGVSGLAGIPERRTEKKVELIRPFLRIYKSEIMEYVRSNNLMFYQDSSNDTMKYERNRIRLEALPFLSRYNPQLPVALNRLAVMAADEDAYLEAQTQAAFRRIVVSGSGAGAGYSLERGEFAQLPVALQRRLIKLILSYLAFGTVADFAILEQIRHAILQTETSQLTLDIGDGWQLVREYERISFVFRAELPATPISYHYTWREGERRLHIPEIGSQLIIEPAEPEEWTRMAGAAESTEQSAIFDADRLAFPLTVRTREPGDRMRPFGLNGSKKVKDIFIDDKVPQQLRGRIPVVTDAEGRIIWIPGVKRSDIAAASDTSANHVRLTLSRMSEPRLHTLL